MRRPSTAIAISIAITSAIATTPGSEAKPKQKDTCMILLDVSSSNDKETATTAESAQAKTLTQDLDKLKIDDVAAILETCRKSRVEIWPIEGNALNIRNPIVSEVLEKDGDRSVDETIGSIVCTISAVLGYSRPSARSPKTTKTVSRQDRARRCGINSSVVFDPNGTDIFGALNRARRQFELVDTKAKKKLYVLTDGFNSSFGLNFDLLDLADGSVRTSVFAKLRSLALLNRFEGVTGCFVGIGARSVGSADQRLLDGLEKFWDAYKVAASGPKTVLSVNDRCWQR